MIIGKGGITFAVINITISLSFCLFEHVLKVSSELSHCSNDLG